MKNQNHYACFKCFFFILLSIHLLNAFNIQHQHESSPANTTSVAQGEKTDERYNSKVRESRNYIITRIWLFNYGRETSNKSSRTRAWICSTDERIDAKSTLLRLNHDKVIKSFKVKISLIPWYLKKLTPIKRRKICFTWKTSFSLHLKMNTFV